MSHRRRQGGRKGGLFGALFCSSVQAIFLLPRVEYYNNYHSSAVLCPHPPDVTSVVLVARSAPHAEARGSSLRGHLVTFDENFWIVSAFSASN